MSKQWKEAAIIHKLIESIWNHQFEMSSLSYGYGNVCRQRYMYHFALWADGIDNVFIWFIKTEKKTLKAQADILEKMNLELKTFTYIKIWIHSLGFISEFLLTYI